MLLNCGVGEASWESLGLQGDPTSPFWRGSVLGVHWKDWCWSWNSNTLATWCGELTYWKRPWCWEGLGAGGEGDDKGWDGLMASLTQWTWVWVNSRSWWWTGRPGMLLFMGSQRVGHDWVTELNWRPHGTDVPPPGELPNPRIKSTSPTLQVDSLLSEPQGKPKSTVEGSLSLLQGNFLTQELNWGLLHCRQILYQLSYWGSPKQK